MSSPSQDPSGSDATSSRASRSRGPRTRLSSEEEGITLLQIGTTLLRHRRSLVATPVVVALLIVGVTLLTPRTYSSSVTFMPQSEPQMDLAGLSGLASQIGMNVPIGQPNQSPEFYADLLRSRNLLEATVRATYRFGNDAGERDSLTGDLVQLYEIEEESPGLALLAAVDRLRGATDIQVRTETGVVELAVSSPWPLLSRQVAEQMVNLVNKFNSERRQTRASEERQFLDGRLEDARQDLRAAEDSLEIFLQQNRDFQNSPQLRFQHQRLQRRVSVQEQVVTSLAQSYEQARIEEVRNTPVITVVDKAQSAVLPDPRYTLYKGIFGLFIGFMLALLWAFGREFYSEAAQEEPDEYREFERLRRQAIEDLRAIWSGIRDAWSFLSRSSRGSR